MFAGYLVKFIIGRTLLELKEKITSILIFSYGGERKYKKMQHLPKIQLIIKIE